jgi:hypothetical protein
MFRWPNNQTYEGDYEKGFKNGKGTIKYPDGTKYVGMWYQDKKHGLGLHTDENGEITEQSWDNGKLYCIIEQTYIEQSDTETDENYIFQTTN